LSDKLPLRLSLKTLPPPNGAGRNTAGAIPNPLSQAEYYEGLLVRRVVAYLVDLMVLGLLYVAAVLAGFMINIATLGLMSVLVAVVLACVAPAYHVLTVGGRYAATPGMRLMGLQVRSFDGGVPSKMQAFLQIALFYVTVPTTGGWILLVGLFNPYRRMVHDILSHTVVLRRRPATANANLRPFAA